MKKITALFLATALILAVAACSSSTTETTGIVFAAQSIDEPAAESVTIVDTALDSGSTSMPVAVEYDDDDLDASVDGSDLSTIRLEGDSIAYDGSGATVEGTTITITSAGTYSISGTLDNGQIVVETEDEDTVVLVLDRVNLACSTSAPIYVANAEKTVITLADGTENYVTDGESYVLTDPESDEPNAAIYSKDDLTINGSDSLTVDANYNDGIASQDDLKITGGTITVDAVNDGLKGKDSVAVKDGLITVNEQNVVVLSDKPDGQGRPIPEDQLAQGRSLVVDGQVVGTVLPTGEALERDALAERYLARTLQTSGYAAIGATVAALLLAVLLANTLTRPLRELTAATQAVAQGDLEHQVPVRSKDELGELASSFNQMSADLAQATALRRQMTADIAHDLRSPLTAISGFVEAMRDGVLKPTAARFEAMYVETQRLRRLVDDLRTLSLTDAGELRMDRQAIPARMLLERLAAAYRHRADEQEIAITVQAEPGTPDLHVDQDRLAQVLGNLIDNALRYTPPGGEITLGARAQGPVTLLTVRDTGRGIPPEHLPYVFDRFYRGDSARTRDGGESGLGLAIAKAIVKAHGGTISVDSTPGAGTTFTIALA